MEVRRTAGPARRQLVLAICAVLLGEMAILLLIGALPSMPRWREMLLDAGLLAIPVVSGFYVLVRLGIASHSGAGAPSADETDWYGAELFASNPHPMWFFDAETLRFLAVNDAAVAHYGYRRDEFLAMTIGDIRPVEDMPHLRDTLARVASSPNLDLVGARHRKKDGTLIEVQVTSHPTKFLGRRARFVMVFDLTERRQAEADIERATGKLAMHVERTPLALIEYDLDFRVVQWNPAAERIFGYTAAEAIGQHSTIIVPEDLRPEIDALMQGLIEGRGGVRGTNKNVRKDGRVIVCEWYNTSLVDVDGTVIAVTCQAEDITERVRAEEALRESERSLRNAQHLAHVGSWRWSVARDEVTWSAELRDILRFDPALPAPGFAEMASYYTPDSWTLLSETVQRTLATGEPYALELDVVRTDGVVRATHTRGTAERDAAANIIELYGTVQDVTERRESEQMLRRLQQAVDTSGDAIFLTDVDGIIRYVNPGFTALYGFSAGEVVGKVTPRILKSGLMDPSAYDQYWRALTNGTEVRGELVNRRKDGTLVSVEGSASAILDDAKCVTGFLGIQRDVSDRKQADDELRASEARYRAVAQSAHDAIVTADQSGMIVGWNRGAEAIFGHTEADAIGQPLSMVMPSRHNVAHHAGMDRVMAGGERHVSSRPAELQGVRKDGSEFPLELSLARWESAEGQFVTGILRDITTRVQERAALSLQGAALNAAANPMVITSRDGSIEWVNEAFTTVTGYGADEATGRELRILLDWSAHDELFHAQMWSTILGGDVWHGELTSRRKDGSSYPDDVTVTPVKDALGRVAHCIAVSRDLTEEKARQAHVLQLQKMESVGRLAGGIAHDFNNLLTVINNTAEMAAARLGEGDPIRTDLDEIHRAGERAAALTAQLLNFSRKQIVKSDIVHLKTLVADMQPMLQRLIGEDIQLSILPSGDPGSVCADGGQLEQVVMNLVINARDAMPTGGDLAIETRDVNLDQAFADAHAPLRAGRHVVLVVRDGGTGMDEATRLHIFEPFFTTKSEGRGTGLGLATVYSIVQQCGGCIEVESALGQGTTFTIWLPRVDGEPAALQEVPSRASIRGSETILIVEDDPSLLNLAAKILGSAGYAVLAAAEGTAALRVLERHDGSVDLVLTDVVMPGMGGRELAERLAVLRPEIRVLYTSGYTDDAILRHGVREHTANFIGKPYRLAELTRMVRTVLDGPPNNLCRVEAAPDPTVG